MHFFISGELDAEIEDSFRHVRKEVEAILNESLKDRSYGDGIESIALIPIILSDRFSGRPERRLIQHKSKSADYRLHIDFNSFRDGSVEERRELLLRNLISAVSDISRKQAGKFDGRRLSDDISSIFGIGAGNR